MLLLMLMGCSEPIKVKANCPSLQVASESVNLVASDCYWKDNYWPGAGGRWVMGSPCAMLSLTSVTVENSGNINVDGGIIYVSNPRNNVFLTSSTFTAIMGRYGGINIMNKVTHYSVFVRGCIFTYGHFQNRGTFCSMNHDDDQNLSGAWSQVYWRFSGNNVLKHQFVIGGAGGAFYGVDYYYDIFDTEFENCTCGGGEGEFHGS
jgi:hypothetical protein